MLLQLYSCQQRWSDSAFQRLWHNWWFLLEKGEPPLHWDMSNLSTKNQQVSSPVPLACRQLPLQAPFQRKGNSELRGHLKTKPGIKNCNRGQEKVSEREGREEMKEAGGRVKAMDDGSCAKYLCVWAGRRLGIIYPKVAPRSWLQISCNLNIIVRNLFFRPYFQR